MKILVVGPSCEKSKGGMSTVIKGIKYDKELNIKHDIETFSSFIDGNIIIRLGYSIFSYIKFLIIFKKYDLFHIHAASFGSTFRKRIYLKTLKKLNKKAIIHIHGAKYMEFYKGLNQKKKKKVVDFFNMADLVLALSEDWKDKFQTVMNVKNCEVLNNGIDLNMFTKANCDISKNKDNFIFLGRLGERKGAYDLVNAVAIAVKKNPKIKVFMAGDGDIEKIKELVNKKKLQKHINVIGWINFEQKIEYLSKVSTMILPSYNEGLPMAILESMASGKAILSTTVGAIPEVITEDNGILIEAGDIEALASSMVRLSSEEDILIKMSDNNKRKIKDKYSLRNINKKLGLYYDLTGEK